LAHGTKGKSSDSQILKYSDCSQAGLNATLPSIETWPNQYPGYEIQIEIPEFTSVCPKTGLPDFGVLTLTYIPDKLCLELKSFKEYLLAYRNLGIFYENVVNRLLADVVRTVKPVSATVVGRFTPRGGLRSTITSTYQRPHRRQPRHQLPIKPILSDR
jgi:7-cyano-7-deazaguanine reductase